MKKASFSFGSEGPNVDDRYGLSIWARKYKAQFLAVNHSLSNIKSGQPDHAKYKWKICDSRHGMSNSKLVTSFHPKIESFT